jgi:hypothetical protein
MPSTVSLSHDDRCSLDREDQATLKSESEHPSNVSATLPLLFGKITLAEALDEEDNVLFPLAYFQTTQGLPFLDL